MGNTEIFESMADRYDTSERIEIARISADAIRKIIEGTETHEKRAMDFGCGTGLVGLNLMGQFQSMLFLDSSQNMTRIVQQKLEKEQHHDATALCIDFERAEPIDLQVDYIIMVQVLLHIPEEEQLLSRLSRMLSPGGHLIIVDFDKNEAIVSDIVHNGFDQKKLMNQLKTLGFNSVNSRTFYSGSKIFMNEDASMFVMDAQK